MMAEANYESWLSFWRTYHFRSLSNTQIWIGSFRETNADISNTNSALAPYSEEE